MRSGASAAQQTLTAEAASVLKHSLSLARRRGHAQVTPLHVAATLLSTRVSLLRRACLKSQPHHSSHPLQCRALELCFNVALNRLPTTPGPLLHGQPSLSNALIAALKRAQAHQRRGCIEQQQQQPLLTIKVELEQLIISILDDPSVSRVMREAGFSSTAVKNNVEDSSVASVFQSYSSSGGVFSSPCSPSPPDTHKEIINPLGSFWPNHFLTFSGEQNPVIFSPPKTVSITPIADFPSLKEEIKLVFEVLLRKKRRNTVIVGDSVSATETLIAELMERVKKGDVPEEMKSTRITELPVTRISSRLMRKDQVEMVLSELKNNVDSLASRNEGTIIYAGDLKWIVDSNLDEKEGSFTRGEAAYYSPVDHLVAEIANLVSEYATVWIVATASYQTYMRCQMRQPPLETQWALQVVPIPSGGLALSLHASSIHDSRISLSNNYPAKGMETKPSSWKEEQEKLTCCTECLSNYENEARHLKSSKQNSLPPWLQPNRITECTHKEELVELQKKWNRLCDSLHQRRQTQNQVGSTQVGIVGKSFSYPSSYPWWPAMNTIFQDSNSISFSDPVLKQNRCSNLVPRFRRQQSCTLEFDFGNAAQKQQPNEPSLDSLRKMDGKEEKITLALGNSPFNGSGKLVEHKNERTLQREYMCNLLKEYVPWQSEVLNSIAEAMVDFQLTKQEAWILIEGNDVIGKRRLALALAESVFGSADSLLNLSIAGKNDSVPKHKVLERALKTQDGLVILVEDRDLEDTQLGKFLSDGFESGKFGELSKNGRSTAQVIFVVTRGDSGSYSESNPRSHNRAIPMRLRIAFNPGHKHKAEWDLPNKRKRPRVELEDSLPVVSEDEKVTELTKQGSFNALDLNRTANEDDGCEEEPGEFSPISSDLTRETTIDLRNPTWFLDAIERKFVLDRSPAGDEETKGFFKSKIQRSFEQVLGRQNSSGFSVEERVLEEVSFGSCWFPNSLFDNWLKDIFQTSLRTVGVGDDGKDVVVRLCLGSKEEGIGEDGFLNSCLPKNVQVSFIK